MTALKVFGDPIFQKILDRKKVFTDEDHVGRAKPFLSWLYRKEFKSYIRLKSDFYTIQNNKVYILSDNMKAGHLVEGAPKSILKNGKISSWRLLANSLKSKYAFEAAKDLIENNKYSANSIYYLVGPKVSPRSKFNKPELLDHNDRIKPKFIDITDSRYLISDLYLARHAIHTKLRLEKWYGVLFIGLNGVMAETVVTDFKELKDLWE